MDAILFEYKQKIKALTASSRRSRRRERELTRLSETLETAFDICLLARSRCEVLSKHLEHAARREDAAKIAGLFPNIMAAVSERNQRQAEFAKLVKKLTDKFGVDVHPTLIAAIRQDKTAREVS